MPGMASCDGIACMITDRSISMALRAFGGRAAAGKTVVLASGEEGRSCSEFLAYAIIFERMVTDQPMYC
jgi:hypothetical protein